ncbi:beta-N-acetylglucosaminidase domain-containing protein [Streptomyces sp. KR80]|uniref:beta-N-acetylglucosaminidase domain-containing protein n=1 Tax=Streptomyces sp. KR80 TaxID=3457426 RepID=UPI003FD39056
MARTHHHRRRSGALSARTAGVASCLLAVLLMGGVLSPVEEWASAAPASGSTSETDGGGSGVYPTPQSVKNRSETVRIPTKATVVTGEKTDAAALTVVRKALERAGVQTLRQVDAGDSADSTGSDQLTVYVGGRDENSATAGALSALGVEGTKDMAAEGYVLAVGKGGDGRSRIALDGVDTDGTYYAAQTLRRLLPAASDDDDDTVSLRGTVIRDWPSLQWRGVVEGFYGPPWTHKTRLGHLDWAGRHKLNTYVYTPKDDPYLRAEWRKSYPDDELARIRELVDRARANHVNFVYVISPGLSICYSKASETDAMINKFESLWSIGVRTFVVAFDDIDYQKWNCAEDAAEFGSGPAASAAAQTRVVNRVQRDFIEARTGTEPLQMVPTEYWGASKTDYTKGIAESMDQDVVVQWTGLDVIAPTITRKDAAAAHDVWAHPILLWDNYPVNDYVQGRLLLGPLVGREPGLSASTLGLTANPMPQAQASHTSLFTVADYTWNDSAYDPDRSWVAGLTEMAGGDERTSIALQAFGDVNHSSRLDPRPAPELTRDVQKFWPAWSTGQTEAAAPLRRALDRVYSAPQVLRERFDNPGFLEETKPWLDATRAWGKAALTALDMLQAQRAGRGEDAWADRLALPGLMDKARSYTWTGLDPNRKFKVEIDPVMEEFIRDAIAENTRWLGLSNVAPVTNLPLLDDRFPTSNMVDGDPDTYFWGAASARPGHHVGVDLGKVRQVSGIEVQMSKSDSPDDYIHEGVVEYSTDGTSWKRGPEFSETPTVKAELPSGTTARYIRLRATASQNNWVVVREITVHRGDEATVSGEPAGATGGALARAADENLTTSYEASRAPKAGEALTVTLAEDRPLDQVRVLQRGSDPARGKVQVRTGSGSDARWIDVGQLSGGRYSAVSARGAKASAIRLVWSAGSPPPVVTEVVPVYADAPPAELSLVPPALDLETGEKGAATAVVTAARASDERVTVSVDAPEGIAVTPSSSTITLPRGAQAELGLQVAVTADAPTGRHEVPVTVQGKTGKVTVPMVVTVWPKASTTNVALASNGAVATASQVEDDLPRFGADKAIDGDTSTRWSSPWSDDQWLQVELPRSEHVSKAVLRWEAAHAAAYEILTSPDGVHWTTSATVSESKGGTESLRLDAPGTRFVRMRGLTRATQFGYSIYEFELYGSAR